MNGIYPALCTNNRFESSGKMPGGYFVDFISGKEALTSVEVIRRWRQIASETSNLRIALQTPEWVEYRSHFAGKLSVGVIRAPGRHILGLVPLLEANYPLNFSKLNSPVRGVMLMGNAPLTPPITEIYKALFEALAEKTGLAAIYIPGVLNATEFANFLNGMEGQGDPNWFVYRSEPSCKYYIINMPPTFEEYYASRFDANMRHNFRREVKRLSELSAGELDLIRIEREEQVPAFLNYAKFIAERSWQKVLIGCPMITPAPRLELLGQLARQRILRSYLLRCRNEPCAYSIGFQCNKVFYYYEIAYDPKWSKASPGKVLLYMLLKDLFADNRPETFYFGPGMFDYKRWFSNNIGEERTTYIMRKTMSNRGRVWAHHAFCSLRTIIRHWGQKP
jgi:CelD/BcsL family acetyltransferase involved in cellulose biosynthesis